MRARIGAMINIETEDVRGRKGSFVNSLMPSATGCRSPKGPTIFGPLRNCIYPRTFRSTNVRKATANKMGIIYMNKLIMNIY